MTPAAATPVPTPPASRTVLPAYVSVRLIADVVARREGLRLLDVLSHRRTARVVRPRQMIMWLARELTPRSLPEIGRSLGGRDHTTVLHGCRRIDQLRQNDPDFAERLEGHRAAVIERVEADSTLREILPSIDPVRLAERVLSGEISGVLTPATARVLADAVIVARSAAATARAAEPPAPISEPPSVPIPPLPPARPLAIAVGYFLDRTLQRQQAERATSADPLGDIAFAIANQMRALQGLTATAEPYVRLLPEGAVAPDLSRFTGPDLPPADALAVAVRDFLAATAARQAAMREDAGSEIAAAIARQSAALSTLRKIYTHYGRALQ